MKAASKFIFLFMEDVMKKATKGDMDKDYKTRLQEIVQQKPDRSIEYRVIGEKGPDHRKIFVVELLVDKKQVAVGEGYSKKEAEKQAAKKALQLMLS